MLADRAGPGSCPENPSTSSCSNPSRVSPPAFWFPRGPPTSGPCDSIRDKACGVKPGRVVAPSRRNLVESGPRLHGRRESGVHEGLPCILSVSLRPKLTEEALETTAESRSCARGFLPGGGRVGSAPRGRPVRAPGRISRDFFGPIVLGGASPGVGGGLHGPSGRLGLTPDENGEPRSGDVRSHDVSTAEFRNGSGRPTKRQDPRDGRRIFSSLSHCADCKVGAVRFRVRQPARMRAGLTSASRGPSSGAAPRGPRCR